MDALLVTMNQLRTCVPNLEEIDAAYAALMSA